TTDIVASDQLYREDIKDPNDRLVFAPNTRLGITIPQDDRDSETIHMAGVIQAIREREATDEKDRSFAVHGVLSRLNITLTKPKYENSRSRIYQDLLLDMIRWHPRMVCLIADAGITTGFTDAPSWVPDWSKASDMAYFDADYIYSRKKNATS